MVLPFVRDLFADAEKLPVLTRVASHLRDNAGRIRVTGLTSAAKSLLIPELQKAVARPLIVVVKNNEGADELLPVKDADRGRIRLLARHEVAAVLRRRRRTWIHTVREEFATYYPVGDLMRWLDGDPFIQIGRHAIVNLQAIERVTHYGDRLYRVRLRDRVGTEMTASRTGAARLAAVLKTQR